MLKTFQKLSLIALMVFLVLFLLNPVNVKADYTRVCAIEHIETSNFISIISPHCY